MAAALLASPILVCLDSHRPAVARSFRERATARLLCVSDARPLDATAELSQGWRKRFIAMFDSSCQEQVSSTAFYHVSEARDAFQKRKNANSLAHLIRALRGRCEPGFS